MTLDLWNQTFKVQLFIKDDTIPTPYYISISNGKRDGKRILFYSQSIDEKSEEVFDRFKIDRWTKGFFLRRCK